jgi:hypothetical protein
MERTIIAVYHPSTNNVYLYNPQHGDSLSVAIVHIAAFGALFGFELVTKFKNGIHEIVIDFTPVVRR